MKIIKEIIHAKKNGNLAPIHKIAWRLLWFIPFRIALALACCLAFLAWDKDAAIDLWKAGT